MAANPSSTPPRKQTVTNLPLSIEDLREVSPPDFGVNSSPPHAPTLSSPRCLAPKSI